jgi:hypothetical protein
MTHLLLFGKNERRPVQVDGRPRSFKAYAGKTAATARSIQASNSCALNLVGVEL